MAYIKCSKCGNSLTTDDRYCQQCGENNAKFVSQSAMQTSPQDEVVQPPRSSPQPTYYSRPQEGQGVGGFILGFMLPFVGFILYFSFKTDKPNASSMSLTGAIIGAIIGVFIWL